MPSESERGGVLERGLRRVFRLVKPPIDTFTPHFVKDARYFWRHQIIIYYALFSSQTLFGILVRDDARRARTFLCELSKVRG